jgi:hypothetical protein
LGFLVFDPPLILQGQVWRVLSFLFIPQNSGNLLFVALALYFYYFIGSSLERYWGRGKFTIYYGVGVLLTIVYGVVLWLAGSFQHVFLNAIYLNLSLFFAFATLFPDTKILFFFVIPLKIKWLALLDLAFFVYQVVMNPFPFSLLPLVAMLNYLIFCTGTLLRYLRPANYGASRKAINFRRAARRARATTKHQAYSRKCAVCGRTDAEFPALEFRYCSRCAGYHCFCADHINAHVHFTE